MIIKELHVKNYRNLTEITLSPCERINVIYGDNAQGKTNIIEAIWLFTGNASFRSAKLNELIQFDCKQAELSVLFEDGQREQNAKMKLSAKKEIHLNQVPLKKASELAGHFFCVVFSPADLDFVKGSPRNRRRFIDLAIAQITPQYLSYLEHYEKVLEQRNALLKEIPRNAYLRDTLDVWDLQLAKLGTILSIYRRDYSLKLGKIAKSIYEGLSSKQEVFEIRYASSAFEDMADITSYDDQHINAYFEKLQQSLEQDIRCGFTTVGVHRDDLELFVNGLSVKTYGSQGQQRSSILTLKLSEANLLKAVTGEDPIILLDDVMSELDVKRQDYILNHVKNKQVFITCCDVFNTIHLKKGKIFKISAGSILEEQEIEEGDG